jgi:hypothetical protein
MALVKPYPGHYREPLIFFYREHQSVETVAENLELSVDAVKQRLSRGRKLLQEQYMAFIEGALRRTNPGRTFTLAVLESLPALTFSAKGATAGAAAAKGGAAAKTAGAMGLFSVLVGAAYGPASKLYRLSQHIGRSGIGRRTGRSQISLWKNSNHYSVIVHPNRDGGFMALTQ